VPTTKGRLTSAEKQKIMDPLWRMTNLYKIRTKIPGYEGKDVTFYPNRTQLAIYQAVEDGWKRIVVLKPRKLGVTTGVCLYLLDQAMYRPNQMCRTIAHRKQTVGELFNDITRFAYDNIDNGLKPEARYTTRSELDFPSIGSKYSVDVEARGLTPTFLHFSEIAYADDEAKLEDTLESLPITAVGIAESTANGKGNWFERTFMDNWHRMQRGEKPIWLPLFFAWFDDPTNRMKWEQGSRLIFEKESREMQRRFKLDDEQILWWDQKRTQLRDRMPELYPSTPEEAFIFSTGLVYGNEFRRELNIIPPVSYDEFMLTCDYGQTNPMVFLFLHQDADGNHICFNEFYRPDTHPEDAAKWLFENVPKNRIKNGKVHVDYCDPSIFSNTLINVNYRPGTRGTDYRRSVADEFRRYNIIMHPGTQNEIQPGLLRMKEYLRYDPIHLHPFERDEFGRAMKGSPHLFVTENCIMTIEEFSKYRWPKDPLGALNQSSYEVPMKKDDHAMDALRYYMLSHTKPLEQEKPQPKQGTLGWMKQAWKKRNAALSRSGGAY
jgi:hypothetical protein